MIRKGKHGLTRADLFRADLRGADLTDADLTDADLRAARLTGANLVEVLWSGRTLWPEEMASLMRDRSEELRPGVWRVVGSGNGEATADGPLVPVR